MTTKAHHPLRLLTLTTSTLLLIGTTAMTAAARPDPGENQKSAAATADYRCPLARVGTQFVRCDNLTGNGVPAPASIPSRPHA